MKEQRSTIESKYLELFTEQDIYEREKPQAIENIDESLNLHNRHRTPIDWENGCIFDRTQHEYVATLENGSVGNEGAIFTDKSLYVLNSVYPTSINTTLPKRNFSELVTIVQKWGYGYGHWVPEALSRLLQFMEDTNKRNVKILTWESSFIRQFLHLIGIKDSQIIPFNNNTIYTADKLYVPTPVYCGNPHKNALLRINETFKTLGKKSDSKVNILISRENAATRRLEDFNKLYDVLSQTFPEHEWVIFESLSPKETIELFSRANLVVGTHGGGLTNTVFCPPTTKVVELMPVKDDTHLRPNFCPNICYWHLVSSLNLNYRLVPMNHNVSNPILRVDINKIIKTIKNF